MGKNVMQINRDIARKRADAEAAAGEADAKRAIVKAESARIKAAAAAAEAAAAEAAETAAAEDVTRSAADAIAADDTPNVQRPTEGAGGTRKGTSIVGRIVDLSRTAGARILSSAIACEELRLGDGGQILHDCLIASRFVPADIGDLADLKGSSIWVLPPDGDPALAARFEPYGWVYKRDGDGNVTGGLQRPKTGIAAPLAALRRYRAG